MDNEDAGMMRMQGRCCRDNGGAGIMMLHG